MNKILVAVLLGFIAVLANAQGEYNSASMVVSEADLANTTYDKDPSANAFFIYEKGHSYVENGGDYNLITDYEAKIKILNQNGYDWGTVAIPLYREDGFREYVQKVEAYTYNLENGKIVKTKIEKDQILKEELNKNYKVVKFTFPNLKEGSVITYKYRFETPWMYRFNDWEFQDDIPKLYTEFNTDIPGNYIYNIKLRGTLKLETETSKITKNCLQITGLGWADCATSRYVMRNVPAFQEEEYMTARKNYLSKMEYVLKKMIQFDGSYKNYTKTWKNVDDRLKKHSSIGLQLKKLKTVSAVLPPALANTPNTLEKAKKIHAFVKDNYKWNKEYLTFRDDYDFTIKEILQKKIGNVTGINILLHNLLKQQGYTVHPVLVSTRKHGYATTLHPVLYDFNYLIVQLEFKGEKTLLDATEQHLAFGEIPFRCLNKYGRLIDFDQGSSWINIKPSKRSTFFFKEELHLTDEDSLSGNGAYYYTGYHGLDKRNQLDQKDKEAYYKKVKNANPHVALNAINIENEANPEKSFAEKWEFKKPLDKLDNLLLIKPFTRPFFTKNPFQLEQRTYPVDFGHTNSFSYITTITIPEGYEFVDTPEAKRYALPQKTGMLTISSTLEANKLIINHRVNLNSAYYTVDFYDGLKEFFSRIIELENDTFISVKKKG